MESTPLLPPRATPRLNARTFLLTCLIIFTFIEIGSFTLQLPQTRIYESIVCKQHYNDGRNQIPEGECKLAPIQGELAKIRAVAASIVSIPGILLTVPYCQLADRPKIGRKLILALSYIGVLLQAYTELIICRVADANYSRISLRLVWIAPIWNLLGGGPGVLGSVIFTMITDVVESSQRSTAFIYVSLSIQISQLVAPVLASWLMAISPWLAYVTSLVIITVGLPILLFFLPETISLEPAVPEDSCPENGAECDSIDTTPVEQQPSSDSDSDPKQNKLSTKLSEALRDYQFLKNWNIIILLSSFVLYWLGRSQMDLLLQYTSARYGQSLASSGLVLSLNAVVSLLLFLAILPFIGNYLQNVQQLSAALKDLWILKSSIILLTVGSFIIGVAPTLLTMLVGDVIYILGTGLGPVARGLLTIYVDKLHVARLHALISIGQMLGLLIGSPLLAILFDWGMGLGREWSGLPFIGSGVLHLLICFAVWSVGGPTTTGTV